MCEGAAELWRSTLLWWSTTLNWRHPVGPVLLTQLIASSYIDSNQSQPIALFPPGNRHLACCLTRHQEGHGGKKTTLTKITILNEYHVYRRPIVEFFGSEIGPNLNQSQCDLLFFRHYPKKNNPKTFSEANFRWRCKKGSATLSFLYWLIWTAWLDFLWS